MSDWACPLDWRGPSPAVWCPSCAFPHPCACWLHLMLVVIHKFWDKQNINILVRVSSEVHCTCTIPNKLKQLSLKNKICDLTYFLDICCSSVLLSLSSDSCLARTSTKTSRSSDNLWKEHQRWLYNCNRHISLNAHIVHLNKDLSVVLSLIFFFFFFTWFCFLSINFHLNYIYLVSTWPLSCVVCCSVWDWIVDVFRSVSN